MRIVRLPNGNFNVFFLLPLRRVGLQLPLDLNNVIHLTLNCTLSGNIISRIIGTTRAASLRGREEDGITKSRSMQIAYGTRYTRAREEAE